MFQGHLPPTFGPKRTRKFDPQMFIERTAGNKMHLHFCLSESGFQYEFDPLLVATKLGFMPRQRLKEV
jgi:hypothetical protein